jgi:predicted ester cyclase
MRVPPTGKQVVVGVVDLARFEDGKVVEQWGQSDLLGLLQQLGAIPT